MSTNATGQFATFHLAGHYFGVEVEKVQEVLRHRAMTRVPLAPALVEGLINLRGQIVTAIDLRGRLGLPARSDKVQESQMSVILRADGGAVSLLVDQIGDVIEVAPESFEPPPETVPAAIRELIRGVYKLPKSLLLVLEAERAIFGVGDSPTASPRVGTAHRGPTPNPTPGGTKVN